MKNELIKLHEQLGSLAENYFIKEFFHQQNNYLWQSEFVRLLFQSYHMIQIADGENEIICESAFNHQKEVLDFIQDLQQSIAWLATNRILTEIQKTNKDF